MRIGDQAPLLPGGGRAPVARALPCCASRHKRLSELDAALAGLDGLKAAGPGALSGNIGSPLVGSRSTNQTDVGVLDFRG